MNLDPTKLQDTRQTRRWGLIVGVNAYEDSTIRNLRYSVNDARSVYELLIACPDFYDRDKLRLLISDLHGQVQTTRRGILKTLHELADAAGADDQLLFYFAGHGYAIDGESYLLSTDTINTGLLPDTAIPLRRVKEIMQRSSARAKIIILDACNLGVGLNSRSVADEQQAFFNNLFDDAEGIAILAASTRDEPSWEDHDKGHGIFTYYLLRGLRGEAIPPQSRHITLHNIVPYLRAQVSSWGKKQNIKQRPTLDFQGTGEWILISVSQEQKAPAEQPEPVPDEADIAMAPASRDAEFWRLGIDLAMIERSLSSMARKVILVQGGPASGKTSLLRYFKLLLSTDPRYRNIYRCYQIESSDIFSLSSFALWIWEGIKSCSGHIGPGLSSDTRTPFDGVGPFTNLLGQTLASLGGMRFIVFIDEIDKIYYQCGKSEPEFNRILGLIRHIVEATDFPIVFFVSMVKDLPQTYGSRFPAEKFALKPIDRSTFCELAPDLLHVHGCLDDEGRAWIYDFTGGHHFALKLFLERLNNLLASATSSLKIPLSMLHEAGRQALISTRAAEVIEIIYTTELDSDEQTVVLWLARSDTGSVSGLELAQAEARLRRAGKELVKRGYVAQHDDGDLCLQIGLMRDWLREWPRLDEELERLQVPGSFMQAATPRTPQPLLPPLDAIPREGVCIDRSTQRVYVDGQEISEPLPDMDYRALLLLAERSGQVVTKDELAMHVWGEKYYEHDDNRISALIYRLRSALRGSLQQAHYLETLRKRGFRLLNASIIQGNGPGESKG